MRSAEPLSRLGAAWRAAAAAATMMVLTVAGCGGGNSTETTLIGGGSLTPSNGQEVTLDQPQGANTTEIVIDAGPASGFSLGVANLPYVTVKVCAPGSTTACATIDHVFLDTGSIGLRLLRSTVAGLNLPPLASSAGTLVECYPFVIGAVWGPLARADLTIGGETAAALPMQIIDDSVPSQFSATADCHAAANGDLLDTLGRLQAKGVLGVGMLRYDCGALCAAGDYTGTYTLYYRCDAAASCTPAAVAADEQVQNPVVHFAVDNNGTLVALPALPDLGAAVARGRLVFGIGTQSNNQLPPGANVMHVQTDPARADYLYLSATMGGKRYPYSYLDTGSNGYFFDDTTIAQGCIGAGAGSNWYCPSNPLPRSATLGDAFAAQAAVAFTIVNTDVLFAGTNTAFATLGGAASSANAGAFVWGLPFYFGKKVYTSIWGQALATNGPWFAF